MNTETETLEQVTSAEGGMSEVEQRLAQISAAMQAQQNENAAAKRDLPDGMACPIDPAERALCEGCQ